ncbi:MAG: 23S rRNA (uracil(1939)-C(5))-methyltransferase RlmD [Oscillospiraceae bacterium]|nr:23S rRNA (uracil(1939)-C(5))-methyltransferase RlmD [Oscillospiraceae bacterium]
MLKKNDIITAEIIDYSSDGNGVARYDNMVIFVPFTALGDLCEIKILKVLSGYSFGRCEKIIKASEDRIFPSCPISRQCGGCDFQHISYEAEKRAKYNFVKAAFERIAKLDCPVLETKSCDEFSRYRNKAQFPVSRDENGKAVTGFYAQRSHRVIPCEDCLLQPILLNEIAQYTVQLLNQLNIKAYSEEKRNGIVRHIYLRKAWVTGQVMVCLVCTKAEFRGKNELCSLLKEKYSEITTIVINVNDKNTNVILGEKNYAVYGDGKITDILCGVEIEISPHSFYQVNHDGAQQLYTIAKESLNLTKDDILLDMYCGTGSIGLSMADRVRQLVGVEIVPQAVENAKINAKKMGFNNARFICADAKEAAKTLLQERFLPTAVVVDPPRKGCDEDTLNAIVSMNVSKISMISCNHATAARDCKYLAEHGYEVQFVQPYDMFPRTKHVECVILLKKK